MKRKYSFFVTFRRIFHETLRINLNYFETKKSLPSSSSYLYYLIKLSRLCHTDESSTLDSAGDLGSRGESPPPGYYSAAEQSPITSEIIGK